MNKFVKFIVIIGILVLIIVKINHKDKANEVSVDDVINTLSTSTQESDILVQTLEDGTQLNTSTKLSQKKELNGLEIVNSQLTNKDGVTTLLATVENNTNSTIEKQKIEITLLDTQGNELTRVNGIISKVDSGKTSQLNIAITGDYTDIYDYKIEVRN